MQALSRHHLGRMLASRRLVPYSTLEECLESAHAAASTLEEVLVERGVLSRRQLLEFLENEHFCPATDVLSAEPSVDALYCIPRDTATQHRACPLAVEGDVLHVVFADPSDERIVQAVRTAARREIAPHVGIAADVEAAIDAAYTALRSALDDVTDRTPECETEDEFDPFVDAASDLELDDGFSIDDILGALHAPAQIVEALVREARAREATDIHLQPQEDGLWCRLRIDGLLRNVARVPVERAAALVSHLKILSGMDIAEHRRAQDGRASYTIDDVELDLRVSVVAAQYGEKLVARLLQRQAKLLEIENLDMPPAVRAGYRDVLTAPLGLFLVTGPTGSGKTTTLYATLQALGRGSLNISTLEDPIEYSLPGITQIQVNEEIGAGFASGLRALLRQDPDVILVGEIRDRETAEIACRAALTGHKVLSTIHTNDSIQAVTRLLDMGVPSHLISSTLRGVLAQRLVRRICSSCVEPVALRDIDRALLGHPPVDHVHRGRGCVKCGGTGYKGRVGLFEYFALSNTTHRLVQQDANAYAIRYAAQKEGMLLLADFARHAVLDGTTTVAEIQRVVLADEPQEQLCHGCERVVDLEFTVCPYCHTTLKDTCPNCARSVESNWEACAHCGEVLVREWQTKYCRGCLAPVRPEWQTCMYCDAEIT